MEAKMNRQAAISKVEAMKQTSMEVENWLITAVPVINGLLLNFYAGDSRIIYDRASGLDRLNDGAKRRAVEEVKAIYGAAGWKVEREHGDQRDPDSWIRFS